MDVGDSYVEAIALCEDPSNGPLVRRWLEQHDLDAQSMRAGFLISGSREKFERAFGIDLPTAAARIDLPVPVSLRALVSGIRIPEPPHPRSGEAPGNVNTE